MRRLLLVLALAPCACVTPRQAMASHPWLEVKTKHFRLYTDADRKQAVGSAQALERYRQAMLLLWNPGAEPGDVNYAAVLKDRGEMYELSGTDVMGYYAIFGREPMLRVLLCSADQIDGMGPQQVLVHELGHVVTYMVVPDPPAWLTEGLSRYLETTRITPAGQVQLGSPPRDDLWVLANIGLMDLDRLWQWRPVNRTELGQYYTAAWVLIHYLVSERPQQFHDFMRAVSSGRDARVAFADIFGSARLSDFWQPVRDYAARQRWQLLSAPLPPVDEATGVRTLSEAEVHAALGWLQLMARQGGEGRRRFAGYRRELEVATKMDPAAPLVGEVGALRKQVDFRDRQLAREEAAAKAPAVCPEDVAAEKPLSGGAWAPRQMVKEFGPRLMEELDPSPRSVASTWITDLTAGEVFVTSGAPGGAGAVAVLRRAGPAGCVVNGWRDETRASDGMSVVDAWKTEDNAEYLILLALEARKPDGTAERRYLALATDGKRAWWAAHGPDGSPQLRGESPALKRGAGGNSLKLSGAEYPLEVHGRLGPSDR